MAETKEKQRELEPFVTALDDKAEELRAIVEPAIDAQSCELVALQVLRGQRTTTIRLFVDAQGDAAVSLKELSLLNRVLGDLLDVEDGHRTLFRGPWHLEVSSPGVDRPLGKRSHFVAAIGEQVKVKTRVKVGGAKLLAGELKTVDDDGFAVEVEAEVKHKVRWPELDSAHTVFQFAPKRAPARKRKKKSKKA